MFIQFSFLSLIPLPLCEELHIKKSRSYERRWSINYSKYTNLEKLKRTHVPKNIPFSVPEKGLVFYFCNFSQDSILYIVLEWYWFFGGFSLFKSFCNCSSSPSPLSLSRRLQFFQRGKREGERRGKQICRGKSFDFLCLLKNKNYPWLNIHNSILQIGIIFDDFGKLKEKYADDRMGRCRVHLHFCPKTNIILLFCNKSIQKLKSLKLLENLMQLFDVYTILRLCKKLHASKNENFDVCIAYRGIR